MPSTPVTKTFSDKLQDLISASGLKVKELAEETGIAVGSLSKYQNDKAEPGIDALSKIAAYFKVSTQWLLGLSKSPAIDPEVNKICDYTGLTEESVDMLNRAVEDDSYRILIALVNRILGTKTVAEFINQSDGYALTKTIVKNEATKAENLRRSNKDNLFSVINDAEINADLLSGVQKNLNENELLPAAQNGLDKWMVRITPENSAKLYERSAIAAIEVATKKVLDEYFQTWYEALQQDSATHPQMRGDD